MKPLKISWLCILWLTGCAGLQPGQPAKVIIQDAHSGGTVVAFNTSSTLLASGGWEGDIHLWRVPDGTLNKTLSAHRDSVNGIVFLDDTHLVSAGYDGRITVWDVEGKLLREVQTPSPITHMVLDAENQLVVTGHKDGAVRVWRLPALTLEKEYPVHRSAVRAVAWDPVSKHFAASDNDGQVFLWTTNTTPVPLSPPPSDARTLQFSPDGQKLIGGGWFKLFRWDIASGALEVIPTEHRGIIKSLRYSTDGKTLASISRQTDSAVYFLDPQSGVVVRRFQGHDLCGADISFSPDSHYLATTSDDASVRLWDLRTPPPSAKQ